MRKLTVVSGQGIKRDASCKVNMDGVLIEMVDEFVVLGYDAGSANVSVVYNADTLTLYIAAAKLMSIAKEHMGRLDPVIQEELMDVAERVLLS